MPTIMPASSLRSYTDVLEDVTPGAPVFLTKNGHGKYAILDVEDYDKLIVENRLFSALEVGRLSGEHEGWIPGDSIRTHFESKERDERWDSSSSPCKGVFR